MNETEAQAQAAAMGWTFDGINPDGSASFSIVDEAGQTKAWETDSAGNFLPDTLRDVQPEAPPDEPPPVDAGSQQPPPEIPPTFEPPEDSAPVSSPPDFYGPGDPEVFDPPTNQPSETPGHSPPGDIPPQPIDLGPVVFPPDNFIDILPQSPPPDFVGPGDPEVFDPPPPQPIELGPIIQPPVYLPPVVVSPPAVVDGEDVLHPYIPPDFIGPGDPEEIQNPPTETPVTPPGVIPGNVDNPPPPPQTPSNPPPRMTATQYANSRTDLAVNWDRIWNQPEWANDPNVIYLKTIYGPGDWLRYLQDNYGGTFEPDQPAGGSGGGGNGSGSGGGGRVISPHFDPTPRQVGRDEHGNPVWRQVDEAGMVLQYRTLNGQVDYATMAYIGPYPAPQYVNPPLYQPPGSGGGSGGGGGGSTGGGGAGGGGGNPAPQVSPFFDDTHRPVMNTPQGTLYLLVDRDGNIVTWYERNGEAFGQAYQGRATMTAAQHVEDLQRRLAGAGGGGGGSGGGGGGGNAPVPLPGAPVDDSELVLFAHPRGGQISVHPDWRHVGTNPSSGNPVFHVQDEAGTVKEFEVSQSQQLIWHPDAEQFGVYRPTTSPRPGGGGGSSSGGTLLLVAGAFGIGWWLYKKSKDAQA